MGKNVDAYLAAIQELQIQRSSAGGHLNQELEVAFVVRLDPLWESLSEEEQLEVEAALVKNAPCHVQSDGAST